MQTSLISKTPTQLRPPQQSHPPACPPPTAQSPARPTNNTNISNMNTDSGRSRITSNRNCSSSGNSAIAAADTLNSNSDERNGGSTSCVQKTLQGQPQTTSQLLERPWSGTVMSCSPVPAMVVRKSPNPWKQSSLPLACAFRHHIKFQYTLT